mgnify:CR=1 FL=1
MKLLRAATLTVPDVTATAERYARYFDYRTLEQGTVPPDLAAAWGCPGSAGKACRVLGPSSGAPVFIRLVQGDPVPGYQPLRSHGWAAIEICVQDVLAADARMKDSPVEIIGPPREIEGLPAIYPMQVKGPDGEIIYLTQIRSDLPAFDLPRAESPIDKLFILVLACSDMDRSAAWFQQVVGLSFGRRMDIVYTMLANAFGTPYEQLYTICTIVHGRDVFLELDQYPAEATPRPRHEGELPPAVAICTLSHPDIAAIPGPWITPPVRRDGVIYRGRMTGTLAAPDGSLVEIVSLT